MGTVYRKQTTRPMPKNAERFVRQGVTFVRWNDRSNRKRTARLITGKAGFERIAVESPYFVAKYRDGSGAVVEVSTGCRHEDAARRVLADLERQAELIRSGVVTAAEADVGRHQTTPIEEHVAAYITHLEASGTSGAHRKETRRLIRRVVADCGMSTLAALKRESLERWISSQTKSGMGARNLNAHRNAVASLAGWLADPTVGRLPSNPFRGVAKANERADRRRQRRALTEDELGRLLAVATNRPLIDAETIRRGSRAGERYGNVRPQVRARLELLGRERALIYKTLVLTGLRKKELASLTVGALHLDNPVPFVVLGAADEKNRQGSEIALRRDLADDLTRWLSERLKRNQREAIASGEPIPSGLALDAPLFNVPAGLVRILDRDLRAAGIPKRDDRGRVIDVHALRHTFGTLLSKGGVAPRTAQEAMRHSDIRLTMQTYTDPRLLDIVGALDALPALPLTEPSEAIGVKATGTDGRTVAPTVAPTFDKSSTRPTIRDNTSGKASLPTAAVSCCPDKEKGTLSIADRVPCKSGREDSNLRPPEPHSGALAKLRHAPVLHTYESRALGF